METEVLPRMGTVSEDTCRRSGDGQKAWGWQRPHCWWAWQPWTSPPWVWDPGSASGSSGHTSASTHIAPSPGARKKPPRDHVVATKNPPPGVIAASLKSPTTTTLTTAHSDWLTGLPRTFDATPRVDTSDAPDN